MRQTVIDEFTEITKQALRQFINDQVNNRLQTALGTGTTDTTETEVVADDNEQATDDEQERQKEFTDEEREGYLIIKSVLREIIDPQRIAYRDTMSYCGVLLDDNNRKPICRLHFNRNQKYIGFFDENKNEEHVAIDSLDDIYQYADRLKAAVAHYDSDE